MPRFSDGNVLLILKDHTSNPGNTPPNSTLWNIETFTDWSKGVSFIVNDFVFFSGFYYRCILANTSSNLNLPPSPTNWEFVNAWGNDIDYTIGGIIVYSDIIYTCTTNHTSIFGPDEFGDIDISSKWIVIEHSEEIPQSLRIESNAKGGRYMTNNPIIKKFDRIYYEYTDKNGKTVNDVFHVRTIKRKRKIGKGKIIELFCPHQSENLWKQTISFPGRKFSGNQALEKIVTQLNSNRGAGDPIVELPSVFDGVTKTGSRLSKNSANDYIFESIKLQEAFDKIKDIEQQPEEGGGRFQAMFMRFVSKYDHSTHSDLDTVLVQAFEQGFTQNGPNFNNTPKVTLLWDTISSGNRPTVLDLDTNETPPKATNIIALGQRKSGSYPVEHQKFTGAKDVFISAKTFGSGASYDNGDLVVGTDGLTYESITDNNLNNSPPDVLNWIERIFTKPALYNNLIIYVKNDLVRFQDIAYKSLTAANLGNEPGISPDDWIRVFFVPTVDYSPLTKDVAQYWINAMAGAQYADSIDKKTAVIDQNCIIKDINHPRDPVRFLGTTPNDIPSSHLVGGNIPNGYKMLVVLKDAPAGTATDVGTDDFTGNDPQGVTFAGNIAEYRDPNEDGNGVWFVFLESQTDSEILDWDEGESWVKNPCQGILDTSTNICESIRFATWKRGAYKIPFLGNIISGNRVVFEDDANFDCVHPVAFDTGAGRVKVVNTKISNDDEFGTSAVSIRSELIDPFGFDIYDPGYFVGANFWSLTPLTSNSIPYFSPVVGEKIKLSIFDIFNMFKTHENKEEWFGPQCEDYYPIASWNYFEKFIYSKNLVGTLLPIGDFTMQMWFADQRHNVVTIEYNHSRNNVTLEQDNSRSKMKPYFGVPGVSVVFNAKEPEVIDVFQLREWQFGGINTKDSFDVQGRFKGTTSVFAGMNHLELILDSFRMTKPLVATNVDESNNKPERNIETTRQKFDGILSYPQLKNLVLGLEKLFGFERKEIQHKRKAQNEIQFGDPVFTKDTEAFSEDDDGPLSNTILAVNNRIVTTHSKTIDGPGGSNQTIDLNTRLFPD